MIIMMSGVDVYVDYHIDRFAEIEMFNLCIGDQDVQELFQEYGVIYDVFNKCLGQGNDDHE